MAVRFALEASGARGDEIACVGFSGQMHGAVLLDAQDDVVRPALIWCDQRTEPQMEELSHLFGVNRLIQLTCNAPVTKFTLTKLLWVRENEPRNMGARCARDVAQGLRALSIHRGTRH